MLVFLFVELLFCLFGCLLVCFLVCLFASSRVSFACLAVLWFRLFACLIVGLVGLLLAWLQLFFISECPFVWLYARLFMSLCFRDGAVVYLPVCMIVRLFVY